MKLTPRTLIGGLACAGALVSQSQAPAAHADPQTQYIVDLANAGVPMSTPQQESQVGQLICDRIAEGTSLTDVAVRIANVGVPWLTASYIVGLAVHDLCPQFIPQGNPAAPQSSAPAPAASSPAAPVPVTIASAIA